MKLDTVSIKLNIFLFIIILTTFFLNAEAQNVNKNLSNIEFSNCKNLKFKDSLYEIDFIQVVFNDYRKWTKNSLRILNSKFENKFISENLKKRFPGKIIVKYNDKNSCVYNATIRQSGDWFDHIRIENGNILQSLDIHLKDGNIAGVTKFKLFIKSTRNGDSEIVISKILERLGYISPKISYVDTLINDKKFRFLFQEKASKELIERSHLKDAPIYEGNENIIVGTSRNKNLVFNKKLTFTKQVNSKWSATELREKIAIEGLTRLNLVYFKNISFFLKPNHRYDQLTLDYNLLSNGDNKHFIYLTMYDALINSVNAGHALIPHNRKFYFDPYSKKYYPIFYDGQGGSAQRSVIGGWDVKIRKLKKDEYKFGVSYNAILGANYTLEKLNKLDIEEIYLDLKTYGVKYNKKEFLEILDSIKHNLKIISEIIIPSKENFNTTIHDYLTYVKKSSKEFNILYTLDNSHFICKKYLNECSKLFLENKDFQQLINGEFKYDKKKSLYLGRIDINTTNLKIDNFYKYIKSNTNLTKINFKNNNLNIRSNKNIFFDIDKSNNKISINANTGDWLVIENSVMDNIKIFINYENKDSKNFNEDRFNEYYLTGCLNIINSNLNMVDLNVNHAKCEDGINIINSKGNISSMEVLNSSYDGIDLDFSNIKIDNLSVTNSGNDCADFSFGNYLINNVTLSNCGDKGISVGETTLAKIQNLKLDNSIIGLASKDSSVVNVDTARFNDSKFCISAYNKKKEFDGGRINIKNFECINYDIRSSIDQKSIINFENEL